MNVKLLTLDVMKNLVKTKRDLHITIHLAAKAILAEFKNDASKKFRISFSKQFS